MKLNALVFLAVAAGTYALGCEDHGDDDGHSTAGTAGSHAGTHSTGGTSGGGGEAGAALGGTTGEAGSGSAQDGEAGAEGGPPEPPVMESVSRLSGDLHVTWMNVSTDCDRIELWRKDGDAEYMRAYTLTGAAEAQHDSDVEVGTTYCYKARCTISDTTSDYSNEKCGTP